MEEDGSDDFVIIEKIGENTSVSSPVTPNTPTSETGSIDSGYEDFVELSFEDVKEVINHCWILICKIIHTHTHIYIYIYIYYIIFLFLN